MNWRKKSKKDWGRLDLNYKETPFGKIPEHWGVGTILENSKLVTDYVANGSFASLKENVQYKNEPDYAILIRLVDFNNEFDGNFVYLSRHSYDFLKKSKLFGNEIIISNVGANVGTVFKAPSLSKPMSLGPNSIMFIPKGDNDFYYYWMKSRFGQHMLKSIVSGSAQPKFNKTDFRRLEIPVPPINEQKEIGSILRSLDDRIAENKKINHHLEQIAMEIFDDMFPNVSSGDNTIGEYIVPKRGKGLRSKDTIDGVVPVVAGGLQPATYHNVANTVAPVITISASGANAGYVNLWSVPVWSSDSSFIDKSMTNDVYFWYIMLKKRQQEIYDSQTGSAQPHIYPKHIDIMPTIALSDELISSFTEQVTFMFEQIGNNLDEIKVLQDCRDALLPKLMSGELSVTD